VQACLAPDGASTPHRLQLRLTKGRFSVARQRFIGRTDVVPPCGGGGCGPGLGAGGEASIVALEQLLDHATGGCVQCSILLFLSIRVMACCRVAECLLPLDDRTPTQDLPSSAAP
jgi:hypothetical protein